MPARTPRAALLRLLAVLVAALLVASCSSAVDELDNASGTPQDGGVLRIGSTNDIVPQSIFTNSSDAANVLVGAVYDSLVDYPLDSLEPEPALATDWELAEDGTSLTLQLRADVTFHDGRPFTSKDVQASIETWADPTWTVQLQRTAAAITDFDTSAEHEITLGFEHPLSNVFDLLDMMPIIDGSSLDQVEDGSSFNGTGPFSFDEWKPGSQLTFTRNDDYWDGAPRLDGLEVDIVSDPQAQVSQLRAGQLDVVTGASNRDLETLGDEGGYTVDTWKGAEVQVYVGVNVENPALEDVRLRQAIAYAIDRQRVVDEVYRGAGIPINLPWPDYSPAYDEEADQTYAYDEDKAKALVEDLVADTGEIPTIPLSYPAENANYDAAAQIVQYSLQQVGIKVELDPVEQAQAIKNLIGGEFEGMWILQHSYAQYTPSTLAVSAYPFNADQNTSHFVDPGYQEDADAAWLQSPEDPDAAETYQALNADLLDNLFLIEMATLYPQTGSSSSVGGLGFSKRSELDLSDAYLTE